SISEQPRRAARVISREPDGMRLRREDHQNHAALVPSLKGHAEVLVERLDRSDHAPHALGVEVVADRKGNPGHQLLEDLVGDALGTNLYQLAGEPFLSSEVLHHAELLQLAGLLAILRP